MPALFELKLHQKVCYTGYPISGNIILVLNEPLKLQAITVHIHGTGEVLWKEEERIGVGEDFRTRTRIYKNKQEYIQEKIFIQEFDGSSYESDHLPNGFHSYPFSYTLPAVGLPTSFEAEDGHVRYYLKAVLDTPNEVNNEIKQPIVVNAVVDLNQNEKAKLAVNADNSSQPCCWCCTGGKLRIRANLPKRGYAIGETLVLKVIAFSNERGAARVQFNKKITFKGDGKSRSDTLILQEQVCGEVKANVQTTFPDVNFLIPTDVPPTDLGGCKIINIRYYLKIILIPYAVATVSDLELDVPLIIGTSPITETEHSPTQNLSAPTTPMLPLEFGNFNSRLKSPFIPQSTVEPYPMEIGRELLETKILGEVSDQDTNAGKTGTRRSRLSLESLESLDI